MRWEWALLAGVIQFGWVSQKLEMVQRQYLKRGKRTEKREESVGSFGQNCCPHPSSDIPPPRLSTNIEQCELVFAPSDVDVEIDIDDICIYTHITKNMCIER